MHWSDVPPGVIGAGFGALISFFGFLKRFFDNQEKNHQETMDKLDKIHKNVPPGE